jgi:hypothetical protein
MKFGLEIEKFVFKGDRIEYRSLPTSINMDKLVQVVEDYKFS